MTANIWLTTPDSVSVGKLQSRLMGQKFSWAYLGQNQQEYQIIQKIFGDAGSYVDTSQRFHSLSEELRDSYLTYIYEIGKKLRRLRWWVTPTAYRNTYSSNVFQFACKLKLGIECATEWESSEPLVFVAEAPLLKALSHNLSGFGNLTVRRIGNFRFSSAMKVIEPLSMVARRAYFILREAYRIFETRRMLPIDPAAPEPDTLLVSWATPENLGRGGDFHQSFFGSLADKLSDAGHRLAVVPMVLRETGYRKAIHQIESSKLPLLLPHRYIGFRDVVQAAVVSSIPIPQARPLPAFDGMDISPFIKEEARRHWIGNGAADALLIAAMVRRWSKKHQGVQRIIYIYENQPWERALCWETKQTMPSTLLVGYQHAGVPRRLLNFFLAPGGEEDAPLPDIVVTVGDHTAELLSESGYQAGQIVAGGAMQMQDLLDSPQSSKPQSAELETPTVLMAASDSLDETTELAHLAAHLFQPEDAVRVILKCHPRMPFSVVADLFNITLPGHVEVSTEPIDDLMRQSTVMVYSGSTVGVQALATGLPVIHLRPRFRLDMDPLQGFDDIRLEAMGLDDLKVKVTWLLENHEDYVSDHKEEWERMIGRMFGSVSEQTFQAFLAPSSREPQGSQLSEKSELGQRTV